MHTFYPWHGIRGGVPHSGPHIYMQKYKGGGTDVGSQVNMHTYADAYTHSNKGVGPQDGPLGYTNGSTQGHTYLHSTMSSRCSR